MRYSLNNICSIFLLVIICVLFNSCLSSNYPKEYKYNKPESGIDNTITSSSLYEFGINESIITKGFNRMFKGRYGDINGIIILKNSKIILEEYFPGNAYIARDAYKTLFTGESYKGIFKNFNKDELHDLASITKSITGLLVGIAIDKGFIKSEDDSILKYFPDYNGKDREIKSKITIKNLLTMTSGIKWNESKVSYLSKKNNIIQFMINNDPINFILNKSIESAPGLKFNYSGGNTNLLAEIINRASGMRIDEFANKYLFSPLDIKDHEWLVLMSNIVNASGDLRLKPRDMAKIGQLILNKGQWNGKRIISSRWIEESTSKYIKTNRYKYQFYGYQWWIYDLPLNINEYKKNIYVIAAAGFGDQYIWIIPVYDLVIVTTAGNYLKGYFIYKFLYDIADAFVN